MSAPLFPVFHAADPVRRDLLLRKQYTHPVRSLYSDGRAGGDPIYRGFQSDGSGGEGVPDQFFTDRLACCHHCSVGGIAVPSDLLVPEPFLLSGE